MWYSPLKNYDISMKQLEEEERHKIHNTLFSSKSQPEKPPVTPVNPILQHARSQPRQLISMCAQFVCTRCNINAGRTHKAGQLGLAPCHQPLQPSIHEYQPNEDEDILPRYLDILTMFGSLRGRG